MRYFTYIRYWFCMVCLFMLVNQSLYSQNIPQVNANTDFCYNPEVPLAISDFVSLGGDDNSSLQGIQITISQGYDRDTDLLTYENNNGVTGSFDSANGILTLTGNTSLLVYKQVIREVFFSTSGQTADAKSITVSLSNLDFLPENGHFYQFFPQPGIQWAQARDAAANQELFGLTGYLATITTTAENQFILDRVSGTAWLGGSDETTEGDWRWVTGPEGVENNGQGMRIPDGFVNWDNGEPNNQGDEDYIHMMDWSTPPGRWNDLPNPGGTSQYVPTGYIVEYGGLLGDPDVLANITGTTTLDPQQEITLTGSSSVCPNIMGVVYTVTELPGYTYEWSVDGGIAVPGPNPFEITVNWGPTNANAKVSVRVISDLACELETELDVTINVQLEPPLPLGPDFVCYLDLTSPQTYSTPETPGSDYNWQVTNGRIVSGNGTNQIEVLWDGSGTGELFFTESTSTATDVCDGDSPVLTVDLRSEIVSSIQLNHVSCFGGSDGTVSMQNVAGSEPVSLQWNTNGLGQPVTDGYSNLPAGTYSVDVNANGCLINVPFTITEPTELQGSVIANDALCFGEASGTAIAEVSGGTGAYIYRWSIDRPVNQSSISNLPKGSYSVDVVDENNCVLTLNFVIDEPPPLVIDSIASTLVSCPEGSDGTLEAFVSGGIAPYTYIWEGSDDFTALAGGFPKGTYQVTVMDANGCTVTGSQVVEEATPKVFLPTAFSPNGDNENDTFGPTTACPFTFNMVIYNRWGAPVFFTRSTSNRWDGTFEGAPAPGGTYTYAAAWSIEVNDEVISEERKGTIRLFR